MQNRSFRYFIIHKPYGMLSQFSPVKDKRSLGELFDFPSDVYPVGRLDEDSEGLLIICNDKRLNHALLLPENRHSRCYLVQVEGEIHDEAIKNLCRGVEISLEGKKYFTRMAKAEKIQFPDIPERIPPVRFRKSIPTSWIRLCLQEGKNRQVRKMTAATGFPTLRLIRESIEDLFLGDLKAGEVRELSGAELKTLLHLKY